MCACNARANFVSFSAAAGQFNDSTVNNGTKQFVILNTSTSPGWAITSISLNFSNAFGAPKFDTVFGGFGATSALGFSSAGSVGSGAVIGTTPSDATADGSSTASFTNISSFDSGDAIAIRFDLDRSVPVNDLIPNLQGGIVSVVFTNSLNQNITVSGNFQAPLSLPINNTNFGTFTGAFSSGTYFHLVSAGQFSAVPEPSTIGMFGLAASLVVWRSRRKLGKMFVAKMT